MICSPRLAHLSSLSHPLYLTPLSLLVNSGESLSICCNICATTPRRKRNADKTRSSPNTPWIINSVLFCKGKGGEGGGVRRGRGGCHLNHSAHQIAFLLCLAYKASWGKKQPHAIIWQVWIHKGQKQHYPSCNAQYMTQTLWHVAHRI